MTNDAYVSGQDHQADRKLGEQAMVPRHGSARAGQEWQIEAEFGGDVGQALCVL